MNSKLQICMLLLPLLLSVAKAKSPRYAMPNCNDTCGGIKIPYPFGMGDSRCFLDPWFEIDCRASPPNQSNHKRSNYKPFISKLNVEVTSFYDIFVVNPVVVLMPTLRMCSTKKHTQRQQMKSIDLSGSPYETSSCDQVFMMEGCPGRADLFDQGRTTMVGCNTVCRSLKNEAIPTNGCFGVNCCQTPLTSKDDNFVYFGLQYYEIDFMLEPSDVEHCLVGSLIRSESVSEYVGKLSHSFPPVVLSWSWPNNLDSPRGGRHSSCTSYPNTSVCECDEDFDGNPYVHDGCQGYCSNGVDNSGNEIPNKYYCEDGPLRHIAVGILGLSIIFGLVILVACVYGVYRLIKRRRELKRRAKFFKRNGGLLLQQQLVSNEGTIERTKIFTVSELDKATDHFNKNRILGQGGQGTVYKGMLTDGSIVAIKKAILLDESQLEQFINEVVILSRINHRHVVKLFGCCLETEVPLLVYEFIPNGTLFEHIHYPDEDFAVSWEMRLKIAADSASAIAYLHSSASIPIYHRDIKSSNILLDEKYRAKVSDFGSSKTIAMDQTHLTTLVQGTLGYLDPEYFQSYQFTEKSDVYSFGVVILELLTSKKPIYREGSIASEQKNLVTEFLFLTQESRLSNILDSKIVEEAKKDELTSIVELAKRCVSWSGKLRPTMKEVAMTLEMIIKSPAQVSSWYQQQEDIPIQYAGYDEFDMSGVSGADFIWNTLQSGVLNPPCSDEHPFLPDSS